MLVALLLQGALLGAPLVGAPTLALRQDAESHSRIELHKSAFIEFEHNVRALPERAVETRADAAILRAVVARNALGPSRVGPWLDPILLRCANADDFSASCASLPKAVALPGGGEVALRTLAVEYARAIAPLEPDFLAHIWPQRERKIDAALTALREQLDSSDDIALERIMSDLAISDPCVVIPIFVGTADRPEPPPFDARGYRPGFDCLGVHAGPAIDDLTRVVRSADGSPACFLKLDDLAGNELLQMTLHWATAALDIATHEQRYVLSELRERVNAADGAWQPELHVLISAECADIVRRIFDRRFVAQALVAGYVDLSSGRASGSVWGLQWSSRCARELSTAFAAWQDHLAGNLTRSEALDAMVAAGKAEKTEQ